MCTRNVLVSVLAYLSYMTYTRRVQVPHPGEGRVINYREGGGGGYKMGGGGASED